MPLVLRNTITLGFAAALMGVIADAYVGHRNIDDLVETTRTVAHSREVEAALEKLFSTVKDAETGQRGYILTANPAYLRPYEDAVAEVHQRLDSLRQLAPDQPDRVAEIARLTHAKLDELHK